MFRQEAPAVRILTEFGIQDVPMRFSNLYAPMSDPPLTDRTDLFWRVLDLVAATVSPALLALGLDLPTYVLLAVLVSTWSSRFVWAALRAFESQAQAKGRPERRKGRKLERLVMRGSHLALALMLYFSAVQDNPIPVYFLSGVMVLISLERVLFTTRRENVQMVTEG